MDTEKRIDRIEEEVEKCRNSIGEKMINMERESLTRLVRLETQMDHLLVITTTFVNQSQFAPVRMIAYGLAGGVLTTVLGAVILSILKTKLGI